MVGHKFSIDTSSGFKFKELPNYEQTAEQPLSGSIQIQLSDELKELAEKFKLKNEEKDIVFNIKKLTKN